MKAPLAPTPPASVGVKKPPYRPPITNRNSTSGAQTFFRSATRSLQGLSAPRGSQPGRTRTMIMMVSTYISIASRPGTMPAMNSLPMSCWVRMA